MYSFVNNIIKSNTIFYFIDFNSITIEIDSDDTINDERANQEYNKLPMVHFELIMWFQNTRNYPVCIAMDHVIGRE